MSPFKSGVPRARGLATVLACSAAAVAVAAPLAVAEVGDGGDPHGVNLRVRVPAGATLSGSVPLTVRAWSEADGPVRTPFRATVSFGASRSAARTDPTVVRRVTGVAGERRRIRVRLSAKQRAALRAAAAATGRRTVAVLVRASGQAPDRPKPSRTTAIGTLRVR